MGSERRLPEHLRVKLSKKMTGLLRHYGPKYGLVLDKEGWASLEDLLKALQKIPGYEWVTIEDILEVVSRDEKGRYEIQEGKIRARYGHTLNVRIMYEEPPLDKLPRKLYHGTTKEKLASILIEGLLPMKRLFVHLSSTPQDAYDTGRRHGRNVVVLEIDVQCLRKHGLRIFKASNKVYLVRRVPPECIKRL